jgi:hypothetical protein
MEMKENFYASLKKSATDGLAVGAAVAEIQSTFKEYRPSKTDDSLRNIIDDINFNKRKRMELYAILGVELANIKYLQMKIKCSKCVVSTAVYDVVNCMKCVKANNVKDYFKHMTDVTGYSKDYINYFIRIAGLCNLYPKLLYASVSTDDMKRHMSYIGSKMRDDVDFWLLE